MLRSNNSAKCFGALLKSRKLLKTQSCESLILYKYSCYICGDNFRSKYALQIKNMSGHINIIILPIEMIEQRVQVILDFRSEHRTDNN